MAELYSQQQESERLFPGESEMAGRMRRFDWASSDLGPTGTWPENLRVALSLALTSRFPILLWWGPKMNVLYNDAYIPFLGEKKHPRMLGQPGIDCWGEIWDTIGPMLESVYATGRATWSDRQPFFFARNLPCEEVHVRFTYGPIFASDGHTVQGVFCPCTEITDQVIGARRLETLRKLGAETTVGGSIDAICQEAADVLAQNPWCLPFAGIYVVNADETAATLQILDRQARGDRVFSPGRVGREDENASPFPLATVLKSRRAEQSADLADAGFALPAALWPDPTRLAVVEPLFNAASGGLAGLVLLGVSPRLPLDPTARTFLNLIARQLGSLFSGAKAIEHERDLRASAETAETLTREELVAELAEMKCLHDLSTRLFTSDEWKPLLEEVMSATVTLQHSDFGSVQLYDPGLDALEMVAHRGLDDWAVHNFHYVWADGSTSCARALRHKRRVIIEDVETDPECLPRLDLFRRAGFRAQISTPLLSHRGDLLGMMTTHFRQPHRPCERELRMTDLYARLAAEMIERHLATEALRTSEERFRSYFELGLIGAAVTSPTKGILEVNDEICRILGYRRDELLQKAWAELTHPDDLAEDVRCFERVMAGEINGYTLDKRWIRKDGRVIHTIMSARCLRRADGAVDYFVGLIQDITVRKEAEEALRKMNEHLEMILASITEGFFTVDKDWRYTRFNQHAEAQLTQLGKDPAQVLGKVLWDEFPDPPTEEPLRHAMSERVTVTHEHFDPMLGEWVESRIYPSPDGGLAMFVRYITQRKRAEEALQRLQTEMAHVTRVTTIGELAASIAHELNQPLGAIVNNGSACLRLLPGATDDVREALGDIVRDANRASTVIQRMRALTRRAPHDKVRLQIGEIIGEVLALANRELLERGITVRKELTDALPDAFGNRVELQQVLLNLIMNSIEAMRGLPDERRLLVIGTQRDELDGRPAILLCVRDHGTGFTAQEMPHLFDAFYTTKPNGLGMGLRISASIVEAHGGRIWAHSNEDGPGATFFCALPVCGDDA